jgi:hypothetical protein
MFPWIDARHARSHLAVPVDSTLLAADVKEWPGAGLASTRPVSRPSRQPGTGLLAAIRTGLPPRQATTSLC